MLFQANLLAENKSKHNKGKHSTITKYTTT